MSHQNTAIYYPYAAAQSLRYTGFFLAKRKGKTKSLPSLILISVFCLSFTLFSHPLHAAQKQLTFSFSTQEQNKNAQENKASISQNQRAYMVQSIAYIQALQHMHATLATQRALAFGLQDPTAQMALVAELYTPHFSQTHLPSGITVTVHLQEKKSATPAHIRDLLTHKSLLDLRQEWLQLIQKNAQNAYNFLLMSSGFGSNANTKTHAIIIDHINPLYKEPTTDFHKQLTREALISAQNLEALWLFHTALNHFQEIWSEPALVAQLMQKALVLQKDTAMFWACLGEVQLQMDNPQEAIQSLNEALRVQPTRARALYIRALAYLRLQQPSLAKIDLSAALAMQQPRASWLNARGAAHMLLEDYELMCADFTEACAQGDCQGLQNARTRNLCLPPNPSPITKPPVPQ